MSSKSGFACTSQASMQSSISIRLVREFNAFSQFCFIAPPQLCREFDVQEFSGSAVGFSGVPFDVAVTAGDITDQFRQFLDSHVSSSTDIDMRPVQIIVHLCGADVPHDVQAGIGEIVDVEKLTARHAAAPERYSHRSERLKVRKSARQKVGGFTF